MSHPQNKRERFLTGKRRGEYRAEALSTDFDVFDDKKRWMERNSRMLRNTTKLCSCDMCGNPRHAQWSTKKDKLTLQERKFEESLVKDID